jgi:hypothetical protein
MCIERSVKKHPHHRRIIRSPVILESVPRVQTLHSSRTPHGHQPEALQRAEPNPLRAHHHPAYRQKHHSEENPIHSAPTTARLTARSIAARRTQFTPRHSPPGLPPEASQRGEPNLLRATHRPAYRQKHRSEENPIHSAPTTARLTARSIPARRKTLYCLRSIIRQTTRNIPASRNFSYIG